MFFDITDPFCTPVLRVLRTRFTKSSYIQIFADAHNQRNRFERYLEMLLEHHVEALIVVATGSSWTSIARGPQQRNITAATIGWEMPGNSVSSVMVGQRSGRAARSRTSPPAGAPQIAFIRGPKLLIDSAPRMERDSEIRTLGWTGDRSRARSATAGFFSTRTRASKGLPLQRTLQRYAGS